MKTLLNSKKQVFGDQGGMKTLDNEIVVLPWPVCSKNSILQFWRSLPVIPAKFPDIDRIIQYIVNGGIGKYRGFPGDGKVRERFSSPTTSEIVKDFRRKEKKSDGQQEIRDSGRV